MKVAVFSDVHANLPAFEAMIAHARAIGVERFLNLGDMVGYYPQPREVVERARALPGWAIQGNHERFLRDVRTGSLDLDELTAKYGDGHRIALAEVAPDDLDWLVGLPAERDVELDGLALKLCHGAPGSPDRYVYPDTDAEQLRALCDDAFDFVFAGHTHYPFVFGAGRCTLVNVGSVGQSKDIGGLAAWGMLDTSNRAFVQFRTPYDLALVEKAVGRTPNRNAAYLLSVLDRHRYDGRRRQ